MLLGDGALEIGGDESFHDHAARRVLRRDDAEFDELPHAVVRHERTDLVAGQEFEAARGIAHRHAHAVAVRVGGDDEIRAILLGELHGERERLGVLGVRRFHRGETSVGDLLRGHRGVAETQPVEHRLDDRPADAVDRGEDDPQSALRRGGDHRAVEDQRLQARHVGVVVRRAEHSQRALLRGGQRRVHIAFSWRTVKES